VVLSIICCLSSSQVRLYFSRSVNYSPLTQVKTASYPVLHVHNLTSFSYSTLDKHDGWCSVVKIWYLVRTVGDRLREPLKFSKRIKNWNTNRSLFMYVYTSVDKNYFYIPVCLSVRSSVRLYAWNSNSRTTKGECKWRVGVSHTTLIVAAILVTMVILVVVVTSVTMINWVNPQATAQWRSGTILGDVIAPEDMPPTQMSFTPDKTDVTGAIRKFQRSNYGDCVRIVTLFVRFLTC
jgi:hypothetical protein